MAKSKQIKQMLKDDGLWKTYKDRFKNRQIRFAFTKIANIYSPEAPLSEIIKAEKLILSEPIGPDMFVKGFMRMSRLTLSNSKLDHSPANWKAFARFMWFQYQTSTYWRDVKKSKENVYSEKTYIRANAKKREYYEKWVDTLDQSRPKFNTDLVNVLKRVS